MVLTIVCLFIFYIWLCLLPELFLVLFLGDLPHFRQGVDVILIIGGEVRMEDAAHPQFCINAVVMADPLPDLGDISFRRRFVSKTEEVDADVVFLEQRQMIRDKAAPGFAGKRPGNVCLPQEFKSAYLSPAI